MSAISKMRKILQAAMLIVLLLNGGCGVIGVVLTEGGGPPARRPGPPVYPSYRALKIPHGHLPPVGQCRIWHPEKPPGHQPPPTSCEAAFRNAGPGTWVVHRSAGDKNVLEVQQKKGRHPKIEVVINHYSID